MNPEIILEPSALDKLHDLDGAKFVGEMIGIFLDFVPKKIEAARRAGGTGDWQGVEQAVHPLKSCAGGVSALVLQELATRLEQLARDEQVETIPALLLELEAAAAQVIPLLAAEQKKRAA